MSTELTVIPSSALTEQEQADLNASIDSIIAALRRTRTTGRKSTALFLRAFPP